VSRETSPYIVGDYWLDKRRDGASPDVWQATTYKRGSRQVVYRSTGHREIEDAKGWLHSYVDRERATQPQPVEEARIVPALFTYWREHGAKAERPDSIACSLRHFLGFLAQDDAGVGVTFSEADRALFSRFIAWRMAPHEYEVPWQGKTFKHASVGVKGETVHSDLARVSAALNHQVEFGRVPMAPRVAKVDKRQRSTPREYLYTIDQLGAIFAVAVMSMAPTAKHPNGDPDAVGMFRWLALQLATACRPVAALAFDPRKQLDGMVRLIDLHPHGKVRTRKRNPVVPAIDEIRPMLAKWVVDGASPVKSRKRAWRTIRRVLNLPPEAEAKTIRYTVATELRRMGTVPAIQIESLLGHEAMKGVTARYAKYDPNHMAEAKATLSMVFQRVARSALDFCAVHSLSKSGNAATILVDRKTGKPQNTLRNDGAAYRTRTCDPRITNAAKRCFSGRHPLGT
jgi:hypothetical protein